MSKLTKSIVDAARPREKPFFIWCSDLPGFGVRVFPSGKRVYYADYRNAAGGRKRMSLGHHGKLTTDGARKLAIVTLGDVIRGEDPALDRATRRKSITLRDLCDNYLAAAEQGLIIGKSGRPKRASTLYVDRGRISRHIKPLLGTKLVRDLTTADINRFIRDVTNGKTALRAKTGKLRGHAIVEGGAGTAARTVGLLGGILSFAVSEGIIPFSPSRGVKRPASNRRDRRLTPDEYRRLGASLSEGEGADAWQMTLGIRLLALTGCRLGEIAGLRWSEVDEAAGCFRLADSKTGASVRAIGQAAFVMLPKAGKPDDPVLAGARRKGVYGGLPKALKRVLNRASIEGVSAHTLRHSFASVAGDLGFSDSTIAAMLGHAAGTITSRYVHRLDSVLVAAANKVAGEVWRQMTG